MRTTVRLLLLLAVTGATQLANAAPSPDAIASGGGSSTGGGLVVGWTVGQSVTGMGGSPTIAETVGFWRWGHLPVLSVDPGSHADLPLQFALYPSVPNPTSNGALIRFAIPRSADPGTEVDIRLFDLGGRLVRVIENGIESAGLHSARWDGRDETGTPSGAGIYFYRMQAGSFRAQRRLVLIH